MKTIIAGSRTIEDYQTFCLAIKDALDTGIKITEVVSGGARGVDSLGERYAQENGIPVKIFPADWKTYGKKAGYLRNKQMAEYGEALIAIWDGVSPGTESMINLANNLDLKVCVIKVNHSQTLKDLPRVPWNEE